MSWLFALGDQSIGALASVLPMNIPGLVSCRIDWFDLPAVQGTLKSLLQHHSSKAPILQHSPFFGPTLNSILGYWKNRNFGLYRPLLAK